MYRDARVRRDTQTRGRSQRVRQCHKGMIPPDPREIAMLQKHIRAAAAVLSACALSHSAAAADVHLGDFIPNGERTNFNGFEAVPFISTLNQPRVQYEEGGIVVTQVNEIITNCPPSVASTFMTPGFEGSKSWYANGGDYGYTSIKMADGSDFQRVGFLRGSGMVDETAVRYVYFELWEGSQKVQSGVLGSFGYRSSYIGFSGGGFNEIRIGDYGYSNIDHFGNGDPWQLGGNGAGSLTYNALAIDSIEVAAVPEPGTLVQLVLGLTFVAGLKMRRRH